MAKDKYVLQVFSRIAPGYDRMNRILSMGLDRSWRTVTAQKVAQCGVKILDVGTGTGDLAFKLAELSGPTTRIVGIDFCERMLEHARHKAVAQGFVAQCQFLLADALDLPFADESFDAVTCAFALRNFADIPRALGEFRRVLKPSGQVVILDLGRPVFLPFRVLYYLYFFGLVPLLGILNRGALAAYSYLPRSLLSYPRQEHLAMLLEDVGFRSIEYENLSGGIVAIHVAKR